MTLSKTIVSFTRYFVMLTVTTSGIIQRFCSMMLNPEVPFLLFLQLTSQTQSSKTSSSTPYQQFLLAQLRNDEPPLCPIRPVPRDSLLSSRLPALCSSSLCQSSPATTPPRPSGTRNNKYNMDSFLSNSSYYRRTDHRRLGCPSPAPYRLSTHGVRDRGRLLITITSLANGDRVSDGNGNGNHTRGTYATSSGCLWD